MYNRSSNIVAVLGVPFHNLSMDEVVAAIEDQIRDGGFHQIATANVDFLKNAMEDANVRDILCSCEMVVPDGMPVIWMSHLTGTPLKERVGGIDLVERLADVSARRGYGVFFLGASETASHKAAKVLRQRYPNLRVVGRYSPEPKPIEQMDHEEILRRIEEARPDILLVAFGNPKQERWISMHRDRLKVPVCIGVGGTLDSLSGTVRRAPRWMQRYGLEWLHRTIQEPRRLAMRYLSDALCLVRHLPMYLASSVVQPKRADNPDLVVSQVGNTRLIAMIGDLSGPTLDEFNSSTQTALMEGMNLVLDMSQLGYVGPESLGSLIRLESQMRRRSEQLWLANVPAHFSRMLRAAQMQRYFMMTSMVSDALYRTAKAEQRFLASLPNHWDPERYDAAYVDIRVELLQDVCRHMVTLDDVEEAAAVPAVFAGAEG